ncbi:protein GrpE [Clostridia bacterium]|nr:protein GrpE [Clostridia bacterium]
MADKDNDFDPISLKEDAEPESEACKETEEEIKGSKEDDSLKTELDAQRDKYLRLAAEYDNFRKRTIKEKDGIYADAMADVLKAILPALDNVDRALQHAETDPIKLTSGLKMIKAQFDAALSGLGVEEIAEADIPFDPAIHNAVVHEEDEGKPESTVSEVLQKGYVKGDRIIRPAMVKVVN